jgi:hypothetical protein
VNTSLFFCVLALSASWTPPSAPDIDPSRVFLRSEPIGLFDQVLAEDADVEPTIPGANADFWSAYNAASLGAARRSSTTRQRFATGVTPGVRRFPSLLRARRDALIRAQSPELRVADGMREVAPRTYAPGQNSTPVPTDVPPATVSPSSPQRYEYEETPQVPTVQPFLQPLTPAPFATAPPPGVSTWGTNGPQPYRLGYSLFADIAWLPGRSTDLLLDDGKFEVFETNIRLNHTIPTWWSPWLFSLEHQFNYRSWQGPATIDLPGSVFRLGWDLRFETPLNSQFAPFALTLAFTPSINSDFDQQLSREAFNFDGRGILFFQADPHLLLALGVGFWDRLNDRVVPYVGIVWLPDNRWEFRIMWPQSQIQYYLGNHFGEDVWVYASGEYHVESYQIGTDSVASGKDQIELEDYRIMLGLRKNNPIMSGFIEGGWVFGRDVEMRAGSDFSINSGFIGRIGIRF